MESLESAAATRGPKSDHGSACRRSELKVSARLDRMGALASGVCAAHCAICAWLPTAFGAVGLGLFLGHEDEWVFTLVAVAFATGALLVSWRRHQSVAVAGLLALGIAGLLASRGLEIGWAGSAHHEHPGEAHRPSIQHAASHVAPENPTHRAGTAVGVLAGLLLISGHVLNLRASQRCREASCE
jgi:hypothetical protein